MKQSTKTPRPHHLPRTRHDAMAPALAAATVFGMALAGFGAVLDGYSQRVDTVAVLGALGMPHAVGFNLLGFVAPGLLAGVVALRLYARLSSVPTHLLARLGAWVMAFSTLAFAAQGVWRLHLDDLDAASSRLHMQAWSLWWLTTTTGSVLLVTGLWWMRAWRGWSLQALALASTILFLAVFAPAAWGSAIPERVAYACWFGWWCLAAHAILRREAIQDAVISRSAASFPGSSPPART